MTDIARQIPVFELSSGGNAYKGAFTFKKIFFRENFQVLLKSLHCTDEYLREFLNDAFSEEQLQVIIEITPVESLSSIQFTKISEQLFSDCASRSARELHGDFLITFRESYFEKDIRVDLPALYELLAIIFTKKELFDIFDLVVWVGEIIQHPTKGECYLLFSKENGKLCVDCISVSYFLATSKHFWFMVKTREHKNVNSINIRQSLSGSKI